MNHEEQEELELIDFNGETEQVAKAKDAIADKLTGNIIKEIYVPGKIVNIVMK